MLKFRSLTHLFAKNSSLISSKRIIASASLNVFPLHHRFSSSVALNPAFDEKFQLQSYIGMANESIKNDNSSVALENYRKALDILQKISLDSIFTPTDALTMAEIHVKKGTIFFTNGEMQDALRNFIKARELFEEHPDQEVMIAECDDNIGSIYYELGNYTESLNSFEKIAEVYNEAPADVSLAKVLYKMSLAYTATEKADQAIEKLNQSVKIRLDLGLTHDEETLEVMVVLGEALINNQKYSEAVATFKKVLEIQTSLPDVDNRSVINCYSFIATAYNLSSMPDKALQYLTKSLNLKKKTFEKSSIELAEGYENIADVYYNQGECESALDNYKPALKIANKQKAFGKSAYIHLKIAATYRDMGHLNEAMKNLEEGLKAYLKASKNKNNNNNNSKPHLFELYEMLAGVSFELKNYEQSKQCYHQALFFCAQTVGSLSHEAYRLNLAVGALNYFLKDFTGAIEYYEIALGNQTKALGQEHYTLGYAYHGLANVYKKQLRFKEAVECFRKSVKLLDTELHPQNTYFANFYSDFALALYDNGDLEESIKTLKKGMDITIDNYGIAHPDVASFFKDLRFLYQKKGDYEQIYKLEKFLRLDL